MAYPLSPTPSTAPAACAIVHLLVLAGVVQAQGMRAAFHSHVVNLVMAWSDMYSVHNESSPVQQYSLGQEKYGHPAFYNSLKTEGKLTVPFAPHLEDCVTRTAEREALESILPGGPLPAWTQGSRVPWISGSNDHNLPFTHEVQRDLWKHQFARDCSAPDTRFLLVAWRPRMGHGFGSQLHLMTIAFTVALEAQRVLVFVGKSFDRADHDGCKGDHRSEFSCYFFHESSPQCLARVQALREDEVEESGDCSVIIGPKASNATAIRYTSFCGKDHVPLWWGEPWNHAFPQQAIMYRGKKFYWWRAQLVRFLMRWPSTYLCHALNVARHQQFGFDVAKDLVGDLWDLVEAEATVKKVSWELTSINFDNREINHTMIHKLAQRDFVRERPYVPRSLVFMHVRQGDKIKMQQWDSRAFTVGTFMRAAEMLRLHEPGAKSLWVSTETQEVLDMVYQYKHWRVYTLEGDVKWSPKETQYQNEGESLETAVRSSLVNLFMAQQCEYFVSDLRGNWNKILDYFRMTGGRADALAIILEMIEW